jgi:hypothetical protein
LVIYEQVKARRGCQIEQGFRIMSKQLQFEAAEFPTSPYELFHFEFVATAIIKCEKPFEIVSRARLGAILATKQHIL